MNSSSSGCYIIDSEYNVVSVNETGRSLYPQLQVGKKCYACLMNLDKPCPPCPVANGRKGPTTYTDPIRNISEIVDAVDMEVEGHGLCHALVFSTVENDEKFAATLPTSAEELKNLAIIKALSIDYYDVCSVDMRDGSMTLYRHNGKTLGPDSALSRLNRYDEGTEAYIRRHVCPEDREQMREQFSLTWLRRALQASESVTVHYRVLWQNEIHYYYRKFVRIGEADSFQHIVVGVGCEDEAVHSRELQLTLQDSLRRVEYSAATGLLTKEAFFLHGNELLRRHPGTGFDFCVLRIDNLNSINHQYGRIAGAKVIQSIGEILKTYEQENNCIAYLGDGAFGSLTENTSTGDRKAAIFAFRDRILAQNEIKNLSLRWAIYKNISRDLSVEEIHANFIHALATIRVDPGLEYMEYDQTMIARYEWEQAVERRFPEALQNGEFIAWYQPKYDARTHQIVGAEALVRWRLTSGEIVTPDRFIPVLENTGLIRLLDREVFRQTCALQQRIAALGLTPLPISVNLSRASIFTNDIAEVYSGLAAEYGVDPRLIPIEITESAAIRAERIREFAASLLDKGFQLYMDDFGSGYSSLASLQVIPFACIKLDKSLISFIGKPSAESLLRHTISFAKENNMSVIAEGVERLEQLMFLRFAGCDAIQGYYFSAPLPQETFLSRLQG